MVEKMSKMSAALAALAAQKANSAALAVLAAQKANAKRFTPIEQCEAELTSGGHKHNRMNLPVNGKNYYIINIELVEASRGIARIAAQQSPLRIIQRYWPHACTVSTFRPVYNVWYDTLHMAGKYNETLIGVIIHPIVFLDK
jgi:hypothetical protein